MIIIKTRNEKANEKNKNQIVISFDQEILI